MRVLVVEDQKRMARYLSEALSQESFAVDLAHDGQDALDLARARSLYLFETLYRPLPSAVSSREIRIAKS